MVYIANLYENKRRNSGTYAGWLSEKIQDMESKKLIESREGNIQVSSTYDRIFVKPWSLKQERLLFLVFLCY